MVELYVKAQLPDFWVTAPFLFEAGGSAVWMKRLVIVGALFLVGCRAEPLTLRIAGSTSVQPVAEMLAEGFHQQGGGRVSIQGGGSTAGVQAVLNGVAEVGAISRTLAPQEVSQGLQAHTIGYDVLTVVVHPTNPVRRLTLTQLQAIFEGRVTDWAQVGGRPGPVHLVSREAGSGSREAFRQLVGPVSPKAIVQSSSGAIRVAVVDDPGAIGYISLGTARLGGLKLLLVDEQAPGAEGYPLTRPLSLVTKGAPRGEAASFIRFARSAEGRKLMQAEGLVPWSHESERR